MTRRLTFEGPAWQVVLLGAVAVCCAALVGLGAAWGGYEYGRQTAPVPTALAEKNYSPVDLSSIADECGAPSSVVDASTLTMRAVDYGAHTRQCVVLALEAPPRAQAEFESSNVKPDLRLDSGTYQWSNITMTWKQTNAGRDLTITLKET